MVDFVMMATVALSQNPAVAEVIESEMVKIAQIRMTTFEETKRSRNLRLNELFRVYVQGVGGEAAAETLEWYLLFSSRRFEEILVREIT